MTTVYAGNLVYEVDIDLAKMLEGNEEAQKQLEKLGDAASEATPGMNKLSKSAKGVSSALAMPEVNKLSTQLAQLNGQLGASSVSSLEIAAACGMQAQAAAGWLASDSASIEFCQPPRILQF